MDEETISGQEKVQDQSENKKAKKNAKSASEKGQKSQSVEGAKKGKKRIITSARITTAASVGGLAARLFAPVKLFPNASAEETGNSVTQTEKPETAPEVSTQLVGHDLHVATEVNDSLSFNEAFAAARKATGPGGLFVWHGHTYGTYYKNEWDAMSQEEQDQYWANVHHTSQQIHYEEPEIESESVSNLDVEQSSELGDEQEEQEANVNVMDAENGDAEIVEVDVDEDADEMFESVEDVEEEEAFVDLEDEDNIEVSIDENEAVEVIETEDEEPIEVSIDEDSEVEVLVDDVDEIDDVELSVDTEEEFFEDLLPIDENEMVETDDEMDMPEDLLDDQNEDYILENADIDDSATTSFDPEIPIDNDMDMSEFS